MKLPYVGLDDFMNAQIQSVRFPSVNAEVSTQIRGQYEVAYTGGKELEPLINKELEITFKLTESYMSYWVIWDQFDCYLHYSSQYREHKECWMEPIRIGFLTDAGLQLMAFTFKEITPRSIGELSLSYAATVAQYNTFSWGLHFNRYEIE